MFDGQLKLVHWAALPANDPPVELVSEAAEELSASSEPRPCSARGCIPRGGPPAEVSFVVMAP
jgi:hypothetical protein